MTEIVLYGFPQSTYVRTARLACEEKGVAHVLESIEFGGAAHRRLAKWTFPIWLYVSVTGVVVYVMLYHIYAP